VPFVRGRFFKGEAFVDLADAQRRAEAWCATGAGMRIHGTTRCRPAEEFVASEQGLLLPAPVSPYDVPVFSTPKVHRDHHVEVARAIYSVPGNLIGTTLTEPPWVCWRPLVLERKMEPCQRRGSQGGRRHGGRL
jgi:hypothetical protein